MDVARAFILRHWADALAAVNDDMRDPKTVLQEWAQSRKGSGGPAYRLVKREGPDHAPRFEIEVRVKGEEPALGEGGSKREAEQAAAKALLERMGLA